MKRVGSIYLRDLSKSKEKPEKRPLEEITFNNSLVSNTQFQHNQLNFKHEDKNQSYSKSGNQPYGRKIVQCNSREISFNGSQHQEMQGLAGQEKESESEIVRKLKSVNAIIHEIGSLKNCRLQPEQNIKLSEIQDRLLAYERKLLQGEIKNYA